MEESKENEQVGAAAMAGLYKTAAESNDHTVSDRVSFQETRETEASVAIPIGGTYICSLSVNHCGEEHRTAMGSLVQPDTKRTNFIMQGLRDTLEGSLPTEACGFLLMARGTVSVSVSSIWKVVFLVAMEWVDPSILGETVQALVALHAFMQPQEPFSALKAAVTLVASAPKATGVAKDILSHTPLTLSQFKLARVVREIMSTDESDLYRLGQRLGQELGGDVEEEEESARHARAILIAGAGAAPCFLAPHNKLKSPWVPSSSHEERVRSTLPSDVTERLAHNTGGKGEEEVRTFFAELDKKSAMQWEAALGILRQSSSSLDTASEEIRAHGNAVEFVVRCLIDNDTTSVPKADVTWALRHALLSVLSPWSPLEAVSTVLKFRGRSYNVLRKEVGSLHTSSASLLDLAQRSPNLLYFALLERFNPKDRRHPSTHLAAILAATMPQDEHALLFVCLFYAMQNGMMDSAAHAVLAFALVRMLVESEDEEDEETFGGVRGGAYNTILSHALGRVFSVKSSPPRAQRACRAEVVGVLRENPPPVPAPGICLAAAEAWAKARTRPSLGDPLASLIHLGMGQKRPLEKEPHFLPFAVEESGDARLDRNWKNHAWRCSRVALMNLPPSGSGDNVSMKQAFCLWTATVEGLAQAVQRSLPKSLTEVVTFSHFTPWPYSWAWDSLCRATEIAFTPSFPIMDNDEEMEEAFTVSDCEVPFTLVKEAATATPLTERARGVFRETWEGVEEAFEDIALTSRGGVLPSLDRSQEAFVVPKTHTVVPPTSDLLAAEVTEDILTEVRGGNHAEGAFIAAVRASDAAAARARAAGRNIGHKKDPKSLTRNLDKWTKRRSTRKQKEKETGAEELTKEKLALLKIKEDLEAAGSDETVLKSLRRRGVQVSRVLGHEILPSPPKYEAQEEGARTPRGRLSDFYFQATNTACKVIYFPLFSDPFWEGDEKAMVTTVLASFGINPKNKSKVPRSRRAKATGSEDAEGSEEEEEILAPVLHSTLVPLKKEDAEEGGVEETKTEAPAPKRKAKAKARPVRRSRRSLPRMAKEKKEEGEEEDEDGDAPRYDTHVSNVCLKTNLAGILDERRETKLSGKRRRSRD